MMRRIVPLCTVLVCVGAGLFGSPASAAAKSAVAISTGSSTACALTAAGRVMCWGGFNPLQLTPVDVPGLTSGVAAISGFDGATMCALTTGGGAKCWGDNRAGQLGDGTTVASPTPVDVVGLTSGVQAIEVGEIHSCAVTETGGAKCWGWNGSGQLGDGTTENRLTPVDVLGLASGVQAIAASPMQTCALTTGGGVKCWGDGILAPQDVPGLSSGVQAIAHGNDHVCALTDGGGVKCWGPNDHGQLGDGTTIDSETPVDVVGLSSGVQAIGAGFGTSCAVMADGGAKCWGQNFYGQLGDGTTEDRHTPVDVVGLSDASAIAGGAFFTCAVSTDGAATCWGDNGSGQLGNGTLVGQRIPFNVWGFTGSTTERYQPDAKIATSVTGPWLGNDVYNISGWRQTASATISRTETATFYVRLQNDGTAPDRFLLRGTMRTRDFKVSYFLGQTRITWQMLSAAYYTRLIAPGASARMRIDVEVRDPANEGASSKFQLFGISTNDCRKRDGVLVEVSFV